MPLVWLFTAIDHTISHLPAPLADAAAAVVLMVFITAYAYLTTGHWWTRRLDRHDTTEQP